jgi:hypothetical protein
MTELTKQVTNRHIGSGFDDFLAEEGILDEVNAVAVKRVKEMLDLNRGQAAGMDAIWDNENDKGWDDV